MLVDDKKYEAANNSIQQKQEQATAVLALLLTTSAQETDVLYWQRPGCHITSAVQQALAAGTQLVVACSTNQLAEFPDACIHALIDSWRDAWIQVKHEHLEACYTLLQQSYSGRISSCPQLHDGCCQELRAHHSCAHAPSHRAALLQVCVLQCVERSPGRNGN